MHQKSSPNLNSLSRLLGHLASVQFVLFGCQDKSGVVFVTILLDP